MRVPTQRVGWPVSQWVEVEEEQEKEKKKKKPQKQRRPGKRSNSAVDRVVSPSGASGAERGRHTVPQGRLPVSSQVTTVCRSTTPPLRRVFSGTSRPFGPDPPPTRVLRRPWAILPKVEKVFPSLLKERKDLKLNPFFIKKSSFY